MARALAAGGTVLGFMSLLGDQGARIGPWLFFPLPGFWLPLALAAAFAVTPCVPRRVLRREILGLAVLLAAAAWPVHSWRRAAVAPAAAVAASIFRTTDPARNREGVVPIDLKDSRRRLPLHRLTGRTRDVTLELSGYFLAPESGTYSFSLRSDGFSTLRVDDEILLQRSRRGSAPLQLGAGRHRLQIHYERGAGPAFLDLSWNRPALLEPLPLAHFVAASPTQVDRRSIRVSERRSLQTILVSLSWWTFAVIAVVRAGEAKKVLWRELGLESLSKELSNRVLRHPFKKPCLIVFASSILAAAGLLTLLMPPRAEEDFYRRTSSESMMQTVSVADLRDEPFRSLWFLHIQPPALDAIRAVLAQAVSPTDDETLVERVDWVLRGLWVLVHGALSTLMCLWLCSSVGPKPAVIATLFFSLHPASLLYATWLDSTLPSAAGTLWFYYELFKVHAGRGSTARVIAAALLLYFTRALFHWPFLIVAALSLALLGLPRSRVAIFAAVVGLVAASYLAKQYWLFGLVHTSSLAGYNGCRSIGADLSWKFDSQERPPPEFPPPAAARVLSREKKVNGEYNFNQLHYLGISFGLLERYRRTLLRQPLLETLRAYRKNLGIYLRPSSDYGDNPVAAGLPWRGLYDRLFSGGVLTLMLSLSAAAWLLLDPGPLRRGLGMAAPAVYIALASIVFERGENMRFKFFLEPVAFVFCVCHLRALALRACAGLRR